MSCAGGACGKDGLEQRMALYGIIAACIVIGVIWGVGYRKTAYALTTLPVVMYFFGPQLSRGLDRTVNAVVTVKRTYARVPGRHYCPQCAGALVQPKGGRPVSCGDCPKCEGSWCDSGELLRWLVPYGTAESTWSALAPDELKPPLLCPQCAAPLELGSLDRLQPVFARCAACEGYWMARLTWTWFELTPPPPVKRAARAETPPSELVFRKDSASS